VTGTVERRTGGPDHPGLLPSTMLADTDPQAPRRRSVRDWVVDVVTFVLAVVGGGMIFMIEAERLSLPDLVVLADLVGGLLGCLALWWRRRLPVQLAVALLPLVTFSAMVTVAALIMLFTVAVHRRSRTVAVVAGLYLAGLVGYSLLRPDARLPFWATTTLNMLFVVVTVSWGMFARARRQLVRSLGERARRAEAEQQLRVAQARHLERTRIAREMHDVLAHRISLVSVHAGALEYRDTVSAEEVTRAAGVIRENAHRALQDLREILGVLRTDVAEAEPERPQPTLADLPRLLEDSRRAGMRVVFHGPADGPRATDEVPTVAGRTAYRVVQEGLTNAHKHAPGAEVTVTVSGQAGDGLSVEVRNRRPVGRSLDPDIPGAGHGLTGLAERAALVGGHLDHGRTADGDFRLHAWLPWPA